MTTTDTATKFRYLGNASTDTFAFSGKAFTAADLVVQIITRATDVLEETLTITTDYSVTILTDGTASIVTVSGKIPDNTQDIQILRALAQTQTTSLPVGTKFPAKLVENSLDRAVGLSQDLEEAVTRSLKFPSTTSTTVATLPEPTDDAVLAFDGTTGTFKVGATNTSLVAGATAAAASAAAASTSASNAATSETNAGTSETNAAASAVDAADSAASVNLPSISVTDTGAILQVNTAGTAYELLTAGTAGEVLTSNGPDAALSYRQAGGLVLLQTQTASASATIDFTSSIDSTYTSYVLRWVDVVPAVDGVVLRLRVSIAASFKSGASDYKWAAVSVAGDSASATGSVNASDGEILLSPILEQGNGTGESTSGEITIANPSGTALYKQIRWNASTMNSSAVQCSHVGAGIYQSGVQAVDGLRFIFFSGNITSGVFKLYGVI